MLLVTLPVPALCAPGTTEPSWLAFGAGYYDIRKNDEAAADLRFDYRWGRKFLWILRPMAGIEVTTDGAPYGLGGVWAEFDLGPRWVVTPSAGAGLYENGDGKDLGHTIEFRTQIEFAYRLKNRAHLGIALSHLSNADISDDKPVTGLLLGSHAPQSNL